MWLGQSQTVSELAAALQRKQLCLHTIVYHTATLCGTLAASKWSVTSGSLALQRMTHVLHVMASARGSLGRVLSNWGPQCHCGTLSQHAYAMTVCTVYIHHKHATKKVLSPFPAGAYMAGVAQGQADSAFSGW
jgi:hypothetical protein